MKVSDEVRSKVVRIIEVECGESAGYARGVADAILSELPEPTMPSWATPEAKAVLDHVAYKGPYPPPFNRSWGRVMQDYVDSLKPKTVELPERWYCEIGTGLGGTQVAVVCFSEAEASAVRAHHYPSVVTVRHVQEGK